MSLKDIYGYIDEHRADYVRTLQALLRQPSIAGEKRGIRECAEMVLGLIRETGAEAELVPTSGEGSPVVYGRLRGKRAKHTIVAYQMYDTQPVLDAESWVSPPFEAGIVEGRIVARGAINSKGALVAELMAMKALREVAGDMPVNVFFTFDGEEEVGSWQLRRFLENNPEKLRGAECVWMPGTFSEGYRETQMSLGNKGCIDFQLSVDQKRGDIHSSCAPVVDNPAWRLLWALNSMKDIGDVVKIEGFYDRVKPPSREDVSLIEKILASGGEERLRRQFGVERFRRDLHGVELFKEYIFQPTLTINGFRSGYTGPAAHTINPGWAKANLDIRLVPDMDADDIWGRMKRHLQEHGFGDVEVTLTGWRANASRSQLNTNIVRAWRAALKSMGFKEPVIYPMMGGTAPTMYYTAPPLNLASASAGSSDLPPHYAHATNEYITIEEFITTTKMAATCLLEYGKI
jgi:acetylornithine deacetylase/succinyl-diaminopimelate desuccinylase-like protein